MAGLDLRLHPSAAAAGKVILFGEHAVVHGAPALAAGLRDGLRLTATRADAPDAPTRLRIPAWDLDVLLEVDNPHPAARAALAVLGHCDGPLRGHRIAGEASIPARAGLGSSAALAVALARLALGPACAADDVLAAAHEGERVFHGAPSGIDAQVASRGGLVRFDRASGSQPLTGIRAFDLLVVPTGVPRDTSAQVEAVRDALERHPRIIEPIVRSLGAATEAAIVALRAGELAVVGDLMNRSHHLLEALGVGHDALSELRRCALDSGALGAKLTGAGAGGCAIVLPEPSRVESTRSALLERGWRPFDARIESP